MSANLKMDQKSDERLAFEQYLRIGLVRTKVEMRFGEEKFNPYHDPENGRFTYGPGGHAPRRNSRSAVAKTTPYPIRIELPDSKPVQSDTRTKPYPVRIELQDSNKPTNENGIPRVFSSEGEETPRFNHTSGIDLPRQVVNKANTLSDAVFLRTGHRIHVTSGRRGPDRQAAAMYDNYKDGTPPSYADRTSEDEVHRVYRHGANAKWGRARTVRAMSLVLARQTERGTFLSRHMRSNAIDIRKPPPNVLKAIHNHPLVHSVGVENDHIHIQFR